MSAGSSTQILESVTENLLQVMAWPCYLQMYDEQSKALRCHLLVWMSFRNIPRCMPLTQNAAKQTSHPLTGTVTWTLAPLPMQSEILHPYGDTLLLV